MAPHRSGSLSLPASTLWVFPQAEDEMPVPNPVASRVNRYLDQGGDPFKMIKAASLVVRRNPDDVEAWLTLAAVVGPPDERDAYYWEAVRAGRNLWQRKRASGKEAGWDDRETRLFVFALYDHGRAAGLDGRWDIALACVREMLEVDPADHLCAEDLAREAGLISAVDAAAGMAMRM